jgi:hypothetical protein
MLYLGESCICPLLTRGFTGGSVDVYYIYFPYSLWMCEMLLVIVVQICSQSEVSFLMYIAVPYLLFYVTLASLKPAIPPLFKRSFSFSVCVSCRSKAFILLSSSNLYKYLALLRLMPSILSFKMWIWGLHPEFGSPDNDKLVECYVSS